MEQMKPLSFLSKILLLAGLVAMFVGVTDPMQGSMLIVPGMAATVMGAYLGRSKYLKLLCWSLALVVFGVAEMFDLSAMGELDDHAGQLTWYALLVLPYPVGWVIGTVGAILSLGESLHIAEEPAMA